MIESGVDPRQFSVSFTVPPSAYANAGCENPKRRRNSGRAPSLLVDFPVSHHFPSILVTSHSIYSRLSTASRFWSIRHSHARFSNPATWNPPAPAGGVKRHSRLALTSRVGRESSPGRSRYSTEPPAPAGGAPLERTFNGWPCRPGGLSSV